MSPSRRSTAFRLPIKNQRGEHDDTRTATGAKADPHDLQELEKLSALQCTDQEIAGWFGVTTRTIESRRKKAEFAAAMERGRVKGRISVRRAQMKMLEGGNGTMGVWLGKQILGQRDLVTTEHTGRGGGPIQLTGKPDFTRLTEPEMLQLRELVRKTQSAATAGTPDSQPKGTPATTSEKDTA